MICSGITYDAGDNRITMRYSVDDGDYGASFNDPYSIIQDIYDTDQHNGWGVFQKYGNTGISNASIYIEGSDTFVQDGGFVLIYQGDSVPSYVFQVLDGANVKIEFSNERVGIFVNDTGDPRYIIFDGNYFLDGICLIKFNSVAFKVDEGIVKNLFSNDNNLYILSSTSFENITVNKGNPGLEIRGTPSSAVNIQFLNCDVALQFWKSSIMENIKIRNCSAHYRPIFYKKDQIQVLIDSVFDIDSYEIAGWGILDAVYLELQVKSTFKINISGGDGATATLYDQFDTQIVTQVLSGEWALTDPVLYAKRYMKADGTQVVENTKTVYEPFTLTVEKSGYETLEIPNIYATIDGIGTLSPTVVEGKMVLVEVTGENLQHFITEDVLEHVITEDKLTHEITD